WPAAGGGAVCERRWRRKIVFPDGRDRRKRSIPVADRRARSRVHPHVGSQPRRRVHRSARCRSEADVTARVATLARLDVTLQLRYGIYYAYAFVVAFYATAIHFAGPYLPAWAIGLII